MMSPGSFVTQYEYVNVMEPSLTTSIHLCGSLIVKPSKRYSTVKAKYFMVYRSTRLLIKSMIYFIECWLWCNQK